MTPQKIFEIKGEDWMKGLSIQSSYPMGGLFQTSTNFDPFEKMGYLKPSLSPTLISGISTVAPNLATTLSSTEGYVYALGDRAGTGTPCFYRIKMSDNSVVDYSDQIDQNTTTGAVTHDGMTVFKNRVIYEQGGSLRSNTLTPAVANDVNILTVAQTGTGYTGARTAFGIGSDGNLYYTATGNASIGKIVLTTGTSGNTASAFSFTDTSLIPRDICNDGIYTIFIADNNISKISTSNASCRIFFWDTIKTKADIIYDIPESYLISARYVDGKVIILGSKGIWICNSATPPRLVFPLTSTKLPFSTNQVTQQENILYWITPQTNGEVYAYGSKIGKAILFNPYQVVTGGADNLGSGLISAGNYFIATTTAGNNTAKGYLLNSGSTRASLVLRTATSVLPQSFSFSLAKVVLDKPLESGQDITLALNKGSSQTITDSVTKTYATFGAKQTLVFTPINTGNQSKQFEDLDVSLSITGNVGIQRVTIYGIPIDDNSQLI